MDMMKRFAMLALGAMVLLGSCDKIDYKEESREQVPEDLNMRAWLRQDFAAFEKDCQEKYIVIEPQTLYGTDPQSKVETVFHGFSMPHYYPKGIPRIDFMLHVTSMVPEGVSPTVTLVQRSRVHENTEKFEVLDLYSIPKTFGQLLGTEKDKVNIFFSVMLWFEGDDLSKDPPMPYTKEEFMRKGFNYNHANIGLSLALDRPVNHPRMTLCLKQMMALMYFRGGPEKVQKAEIVFTAIARADGQPIETPVASGELVRKDQAIFQQSFLRDGAIPSQSGYQRSMLILTAKDEVVK